MLVLTGLGAFCTCISSLIPGISKLIQVLYKLLPVVKTKKGFL